MKTQVSIASPSATLFLLATLAIQVAAQSLSVPHERRAAVAADPLEESGWFERASAEIQRAEYRFTSVDGEGPTWSAPNRAQGLRSRVSADGVEVLPRSAGEARWRLELGTSSFGREGDARPLGAATVQVEGDRAELDHGPIKEWFVNDERGLEQGWTIAEKPRGVAPLWIGLAIGGDLSLRVDEAKRSGVFVDGNGDVRLRYTGLVAFDATGRALDAALMPSPIGVGIRVDDRHATYPLTVDPVLSGPAWNVESNQTGANFGLSVAPAGDVNGDGFSDVIVGAYAYDHGEQDEGAAFVYLGSSSGLATTPIWTGESNQTGAAYGTSVATAGDVNGDGVSDVIVGAIVYTDDQLGEGRAFVYFGSLTGPSPTPDWTADGDQEMAFFGRSVATAGDVNGDGFSDVIVGVQEWHNGEAREGRACLYYGSSAGLTPTPVWTMEGDQVEALFGWSVATAGDVNGDGFDDFLVGAYRYDAGETDEGRAYMFLGSPTIPSTNAAWKVGGDQVDADFGVCVATAGDVNADGYGDVIVGARLYDNGETNEGRAFLFLGSSSGLSTTAAWTAESNQAHSQYAYSVATAGDVNGDGHSDVLVGAYDYDNGETGEGKAWLFLGTDSGLETTAAWTSEGDQTGAGHGVQVATAGDVNADGLSDVIVGTYWYDNGQTDEGRVHVYFGAGASLASSAAWVTESPDGASHISVTTGAGDVNGDGYSDFVVSMSRFEVGQVDVGRVALYLGSAAGPSANPASTVVGDQAGAFFGASVAAAGDVNGDGFDDLIVGAPYYDNGQTDEGRVFVYLGSATGLSISAAWTAEGDLSSAYFGNHVSTAGDVNGDGYGDIAIDAGGYDNGEVDEGRAFIYLGSASGLAAGPSWTAEGDRPNAQFGAAVGAAGDVNGDGYGDVILVSPGYDPGFEGRVFVYLGSPAGLSTAPAWTVGSPQPDSYFGSSASTAGDVNGDGFSDVIVGAALYDTLEPDRGCVFVYTGSSVGLSAAPVWTAQDGNGSQFGFNPQYGTRVASAGDVNGDGYGDVIVSAPTYSHDQFTEGRMFVYLGSSSGLAASAGWIFDSDDASAFLGGHAFSAGDVNGDGFGDVIFSSLRIFGTVPDRAYLFLGNEGRGGWTLGAQQRHANDAAPIALLGGSSNDQEFRVKLGFERQIAGFDWSSGSTGYARLEWEVKPLDVALDGTVLQSNAQFPISGAPLVFNESSQFHPAAGPMHAAASGPYRWRARIRVNNPLFPVTRWVSIPGNGVTEAKLSAPPVLLDPPIPH